MVVFLFLSPPMGLCDRVVSRGLLIAGSGPPESTVTPPQSTVTPQRAVSQGVQDEQSSCHGGRQPLSAEVPGASLCICRSSPFVAHVASQTTTVAVGAAACLPQDSAMDDALLFPGVPAETTSSSLFGWSKVKQSLLPTDFWRCCPWFFRKGPSAVTGPLREAQECAHVGLGAA